MIRTKYTCCKDCTDREIGCHSTCSRYAEYRKLIEAENKALRDSKQGRVFKNYNEVAQQYHCCHKKPKNGSAKE